ncbi:28709_t:CDS:2, partial [Gigaspora margarita]
MAEDNEESLLPLVQLSLSSILVKTYGDIYFNIQNTECAIKFFEDLDILPKIRTCSKCQSSMRKTKDNSRGDKQKWACTLKTACVKASLPRYGTSKALYDTYFAEY